MAIFGSKTEEENKSSKEVLVNSVKNSPFAFVLVGPRISEKASKLNKESKYVFVVQNDANKISVKKAVEAVYKVKVLAVNIIKNSGKTKNFGRTSGRTSAFKKAIITLKPGQSIETGAGI